MQPVSFVAAVSQVSFTACLFHCLEPTTRVPHDAGTMFSAAAASKRWQPLLRKKACVCMHAHAHTFVPFSVSVLLPIG